MLCTLAKVSVWAHGLTYLDDHLPDNGPYFYGNSFYNKFNFTFYNKFVYTNNGWFFKIVKKRMSFSIRLYFMLLIYNFIKKGFLIC